MRGKKSRAAIAAAEAPARGRETILLVEDERQIVHLCRSYLAAQGYTVLVAERPAEAIDLCRHHAGAIDLLVTDVVMPGMNGKELSQRIAALKPGIAVLFMSGYTWEVIGHQGIVDRDTHFIQKPFELRDLAAKVRAVLEHP
jgi:DNA-binding response OmpR family regulator